MQQCFISIFQPTNTNIKNVFVTKFQIIKEVTSISISNMLIDPNPMPLQCQVNNRFMMGQGTKINTNMFMMDPPTVTFVLELLPSLRRVRPFCYLCYRGAESREEVKWTGYIRRDELKGWTRSNLWRTLREVRLVSKTTSALICFCFNLSVCGLLVSLFCWNVSLFAVLAMFSGGRINN